MRRGEPDSGLMLIPSIHLSRDHGARPQVLGHKAVHSQPTVLCGYDSGILPGKTPREFVHSNKRSSMSPPLQTSKQMIELMTRSVNYDTTI